MKEMIPHILTKTQFINSFIVNRFTQNCVYRDFIKPLSSNPFYTLPKKKRDEKKSNGLILLTCHKKEKEDNDGLGPQTTKTLDLQPETLRSNHTTTSTA